MMQETTVDYIYNVCTVEEKVDNKKKELQIGANIKKKYTHSNLRLSVLHIFLFLFLPKRWPA